MDKKIKTGLKRGFILFGLFLLFTFISSRPEIERSGFSWIMWFINFLLFVGAVLLIATSWGAHLKSKLKK